MIVAKPPKRNMHAVQPTERAQLDQNGSSCDVWSFSCWFIIPTALCDFNSNRRFLKLTEMRMLLKKKRVTEIACEIE